MTSLAALLSLVGVSGFAQTPAVPTVLGQVESVEAASQTVTIKTADGVSLTVTLAEKGALMKVAPGETSLNNATAVEFSGITVGDRLLVRGGSRTENKVDGALRIVVMARTDLAARDEADRRAWRERGIVGTVVAVDPGRGEFTLKLSSTASAQAVLPRSAATPGTDTTVVVEAKSATFHRYSNTSTRFADAKPARLEDIAEDDQLRLLGTRSKDGSRVSAERVVFGHFKTVALSIESVDLTTGLLDVKDLQSNQRFAISVVPSGTMRRIPAEMAALLGVLASASGGSPPGRRPEGAAQATGTSGVGQPGGRDREQRGTSMGREGSGRPNGRGPGGRMAPGRALEDMLTRMPTITLADLKKDDWIGAVVGRIDASGRAVAFNILAGIEIFASRANRGGGVDVGMPAGLLDGDIGVP